MGVAASRPPALPPREEWWLMHSGRGYLSRTVALPVCSRIFVVCVLLQAVVIIGVNTTISVLISDCLSTLVLGLSSSVTLFMSYFAVEAVRTDNSYQ